MTRNMFILAATGFAMTASIVGAGSAVAATPSATAVSTTVAPKTITYIPDVAAIAAHLPKGAHVKLVPAQSTSAIRPAITEQGCTSNWGVRVFVQSTGCLAFGYTGTASMNFYVLQIETDNNRGYMSFNKDLTPYNGYAYNSCEFIDFTVGEYDTALLTSLTITGWQPGLVCGELAEITFE